MLSGQVIGVSEAVTISLMGIFIVMLELAMLACFIIVLSKVMAKIGKKTAGKLEKVAPALKSPIPTAPQLAPVNALGQEEEDELAVIMTTVLEECGLEPHEAIFQSIVRIQ